MTTFNFTDKADLALLLDPTRRIVMERGYKIPRNFLDQVCTGVRTHLPVTKLWVQIFSSGELRVRLFFRSAEQRDQSLAVLASTDLKCATFKSTHQDTAAAFALKVCVPLNSLLSQAVSPADNAARIAQVVERVLAHAASNNKA